MQRRAFLAGAAVVTVLPIAAEATPDELAAAIKNVTGGAPLRAGGMTLDAPPLIENGNAVPVTITVDSPMTVADYVKEIHLFNEKNPQPHVFSAWLSPGNGRATITARIKLAATQKIVAVAETSKGEFLTASGEVIVTLAACVEDII